MDTIQRLSQIKVFEVMGDEDRARWALKFRREPYMRGEVVVRENDRPTAFYIVDQGELRACVRAADQTAPRAYYYPGDFFGDTGLLTGEPGNATVDVLTEAELLVLDKLDFDQLLEEFPDIRDGLRRLGRQREAAGRTRFSWERPDEVTLFFSTKHWISLLRVLPLSLILGIAGLGLTNIYLRTDLGGFPAAVLMVSAGTSLALTVWLSIYRFFDWRNDHYIVTNLRVLHVERVLLLQESRDEAPIERVQDVQVRQEGFFSNVLNFGDAIIQTAAATENIIFSDVPRPEYVRDALFAPLEHARIQERAEVRESIRQELGRRLNIPVASFEEQADSEIRDGLESPALEKAQENEKATFDVLGWLRRVWQWLRSRSTFETWIVSDDGNTITWRKNGWLLLRESLLPGFAATVVIFLFLWLLSKGIGLPLLPLLLLLVLLSIFGWWFYKYWDWQNDIYQISGSRLIDLKKRPLFLEEFRRETTLDRVENIGLSIPGPIAQLLNYGTVVIETAGETGAFEFEYVHDPRGVHAEIFDRRERFNRQQIEAEKGTRHAEMAEWFEIYEELKNAGHDGDAKRGNEEWG